MEFAQKNNPVLGFSDFGCQTSEEMVHSELLSADEITSNDTEACSELPQKASKPQEAETPLGKTGSADNETVKPADSTDDENTGSSVTG